MRLTKSQKRVLQTAAKDAHGRYEEWVNTRTPARLCDKGLMMVDPAGRFGRQIQNYIITAAGRAVLGL